MRSLCCVTGAAAVCLEGGPTPSKGSLSGETRMEKQLPGWKRSVVVRLGNAQGEAGKFKKVRGCVLVHPFRWTFLGPIQYFFSRRFTFYPPACIAWFYRTTLSPVTDLVLHRVVSGSPMARGSETIMVQTQMTRKVCAASSVASHEGHPVSKVTCRNQ